MNPKSFILMALIFAFHSSVEAAVLVGYWPFEEGGGDAVYDSSGFSNTGVLTGALRGSSGKVGLGLSFDGTGGVTIPNSPSLDSLPGGFTMSAWIKPTAFPEYTTLFFKTDRDNRIHMLHFQVGDNVDFPVTQGRMHSAMNREEPSGGFQSFTDRIVDLNKWQYVTWTYDESFMRLWLNGDQVYSAPFTQPWVGNDIDLLIGQHPLFDYANFVGMMDEARIYRGALTRGEILLDMHSSGVIPEPSTLVMLGIGALIFAHRKKWKPGKERK